MTPVTIMVPEWAWVVFSLTFIGFVFYLGGLHSKISEMCSEFPKMRTALTRISEILLQNRLSDEFIFSQSPVKLTPQGERAVKLCGFYPFYEINKSVLISRIKKYPLLDHCSVLKLRVERCGESAPGTYEDE